MPKRPTHLQVEQSDEQIVATVQLEELLYSIDVEAVHRELEALFQAQPKSTMIVNLEHVQAVSSEWIGASLMLQRQAREGGGDFRMCCLDEKVLHTFQLSRVDSALNLFETLAEARD